MRINILLCDTFPGYLPEYIPSYVSMFTTLFDTVKSGIEYKVYRTLDGELPPLPASGIASEEEIYLIPGCNLSAYDNIEWIKQLIGWIRQADKVGAKMMGVCFGHQIIAYALGGWVERAPQGWGIGLRESNIVDSEAAQYFGGDKMRLLYNHHDQVVALPRGATLVATSDFCKIESFRVDNRIVTFQGHPEYTHQYEHHLLDNFTAGEPVETCQKAKASLDLATHQGDLAARFAIDRLFSHQKQLGFGG